MRVLLVDDHDFFRRGLRGLIEQHGIDVVGEAASGHAALELARTTQPDVVVMDLDMPGMNGVEAVRELLHDDSHARVVVLTVSSASHDVIEAMVAGACGYLLKDARIDVIADAIRAAAAGDGALAPSVVTRLIEHVRARETGRRAARAVHLSERETQVLLLIASGEDNNGIAEALSVSKATVKTHVSAILEKLGAENRVQAAIYAVRQGLI